MATLATVAPVTSSVALKRRKFGVGAISADRELAASMHESRDRDPDWWNAPPLHLNLQLGMDSA
jgi:hypothetical protein